MLKRFMPSIIFVALLGVVVGYLLRHIHSLQKIHTTITLTICFMLFVLGLSVGANAEIVHHLWEYGWQALLITVASMLGSVLAAYIFYHYIYTKH